MGFQADMRAAAVSLLTDYASDASIKLQVYRARPRSLMPPTAFVDSLPERFDFLGPTLIQRHPRCYVVVLHGLFDSGEAVDQRDAFVDGFVAWCLTRYHQAGGNTTIGLIALEDIPDYTPDWVPPSEQKTYYATRFELEGLALGT
jgi:hypothetical protein